MVSSAEWDFIVVLNDAHISNCFQPYYTIRPEKLHHSYSNFEIILVWNCIFQYPSFIAVQLQQVTFESVHATNCHHFGMLTVRTNYSFFAIVPRSSHR